ncbi:MAG: 50S ribosomal protein L29 [Bacteroidales bacterium]|nr:50S ribosomal protein L29 [Bacteroidales bacterium]
MKKEEGLKELSTNDLIERLDNETTHLTKLRLNHAVNPLDNPNTLKAYRRSIARIKTELRRREIEQS